MKQILRLVAVVAAASVLGCGYTAKSALPSHLKTVHVESFKNSIDFTSIGGDYVYVPLLEVKAHEAVVNRFLFDGNLRLEAEPDTADLVLKAELIDYRRFVLRRDDSDDAEEYRIQIAVSISVYDRHGEQMLWESGRFVGEADYFTQGPQVSSEDDAVDKAVKDLAKRIVEKTIENW